MAGSHYLSCLIAALLLAASLRAAPPDAKQIEQRLQAQARAWRESVRQVTLAQAALRAAEGKKPANLGSADWERQVRGPFLVAAEKAAAEALALDPALQPRPSLARAMLQRWLVDIQTLRGDWALEVLPHPEYATELALISGDKWLARPDPAVQPETNPWSEALRVRRAELGEEDLLALLTRLDELRENLAAARATEDELAAAVQACERAAKNATNVRLPSGVAGYLAEPGYWLALARLRAGDQAAARTLLERAERDTLSGLFRQRYRRGLARLDALAGNPAAAHERWRKIVSDLRGMLGNAGIHLDEAAQRNQLAAARPFLEEYLAFLAAHPGEQAEPDDFNLRHWKGAAFVLQQRNHLERKHPALAPLYAEWSPLVREVAKIYTETNAGGVPLKTEGLPAKLTRLAELEADISRRRNRMPKSMPAPPDVVLPEKTVLFDYYLYSAEPDAAAPTPRLACLVSRRRQATIFVDLGDAAELDKQLAAWSRDLYRGSWLDRGARRVLDTAPPAKEDLAAAIRAALWRPLEKFIEPGDHVLISPDGRLAELPWAALPGAKAGTFLLEDHALSLAPVPSLVQPLASFTKTPPGQGLLVVGDVDFGSPAGAAAAEFPALPGTAEEARLIAGQFSAAFPQQAVSHLAKQQASEAAVAAAIAGKRYIHLATHGWFLPRPRVSKPGAMLTGLVFANAAGANGTDDNILTAAEAATLDLSGVDLAVLSACETGLGVVESGEGVLGLQRAFQVAGARSVVVSLWQVDDAATQALMVEFYKNLWERKLPRGEALRQAQLGLLRARPADGAADRSHPFFWAAFTLSGAWK